MPGVSEVTRLPIDKRVRLAVVQGNAFNFLVFPFGVERGNLVPSVRSDSCAFIQKLLSPGIQCAQGQS